MSRDYQNNRIGYDPYDQDFDSGYSVQANEYRDLYNPYKSLWRQAVSSKTLKGQAVGKPGYYGQEEQRGGGAESGKAFRHAQAGAVSTGYQRIHQPEKKYGQYGKVVQGEEQIFDSGYDVTKRNTYGNQTTGYGPRD
mgnify:CR=1 FL=1